MVEKGIRASICHAIHRHAKANNRYMKYYDKVKESSYIQYWDENNLYDLACLKNYPWMLLNVLNIYQSLIKNLKNI